MKKRIKSFGYAGKGILYVLKSEPNMKIHFGAMILVIACGYTFGISLMEWTLCVLCFGMVLGAEMLNTAIEKTVDVASPNHNNLAGKAKDAAAGGVLICAIFSAIVGLLIFVPKGWSMLFS